MNLLRVGVAFIASLTLALIAPTAAMADTVTWSGSLEPGDPSWVRPSCPGDFGNGAEWWDARAFSVDADGSYAITMTASSGDLSPDGYYLLYLETFDPLAPDDGCIAADDDSASLNPALTVNLTAGVVYWLVTTQCCDGIAPIEAMGYTNEISGPGVVTLYPSAIIVEPSSLSISESGTSESFTVRLGAPTIGGADVTIPLTSSNPAEGTVPASVTISAAQWATGVSVPVTPIHDGVVDGDATFSVLTGDPASADVNFDALTDTDVPDVTVVNADVDVAALPQLADTGRDSSMLVATAGLLLMFGGALVIAARSRVAR